MCIIHISIVCSKRLVQICFRTDIMLTFTFSNALDIYKQLETE